MSAGTILELVAAAVLLIAGVWLYRRNRAVDRGYGSQGAVLLFVIAIIVGIHALGLMKYHPSASELEIMKARAQ
jgi:hypothetical protein